MNKKQFSLVTLRNTETGEKHIVYSGDDWKLPDGWRTAEIIVWHNQACDPSSHLLEFPNIPYHPYQP